MAVRYYDDAIIQKIQKWIPESSTLRVLKPEESKRLYELTAEDSNDKPFKLPFISLNRNNDIELLSAIKQSRSFDGLKLISTKDKTAHLNVIPIKVEYQMDIYTKTYAEGDEYVRNFVFKLLNNPVIKIEIPYNDVAFQHVANIRLLSTISDTSSITEHLFAGQFTRWTIQFELQDAFLFSIPYRQNWRIIDTELDITKTVATSGEIEKI